MLSFFKDGSKFKQPGSTVQAAVVILTYVAIISSVSSTISSLILTDEFSEMPLRAARDPDLQFRRHDEFAGKDRQLLGIFGLRSSVWLVVYHCAYPGEFAYQTTRETEAIACRAHLVAPRQPLYGGVNRNVCHLARRPLCAHHSVHHNCTICLTSSALYPTKHRHRCVQAAFRRDSSLPTTQRNIDTNTKIGYICPLVYRN